MVVKAVSNFKVDNSKDKVANYEKSNNYMSRASILNQTTDSFSKSNNSSQISFKANYTTLGKGLAGKTGSRITTIAKRIGEETSEALNRSVRKLTKNNESSFVDSPIISQVDVVDKAILKAAAEHVEKNPDDAEKVIKAIKYAEKHKNSTGAYSQLGDNEIKKAIGKENVSFGNDDICEVASNVASSAAGETVKAATSEVGRFIVEETAFGTVFDAATYAIDTFIPGGGFLIRWGRRAYKIGKIASL